MVTLHAIQACNSLAVGRNRVEIRRSDTLEHNQFIFKDLRDLRMHVLAQLNDRLPCVTMAEVHLVCKVQSRAHYRLGIVLHHRVEHEKSFEESDGCGLKFVQAPLF